MLTSPSRLWSKPDKHTFATGLDPVRGGALASVGLGLAVEYVATWIGF